MAEFGSHRSSAAVTRPSLFEVLAQENLASGLRSAFRHLFRVFCENFPHRVGPCFKYFEEIYAVTDFVFQYVHMRTYVFVRLWNRGETIEVCASNVTLTGDHRLVFSHDGDTRESDASSNHGKEGGSDNYYSATFAEHFYGLKRIPDPRQLSVSEKRLLYCLVISIVFPYMQLQLENMYKKLKEKEVDGLLHRDKGVSGKITLMYLRSYPYIHYLWEMIGLFYYMAYAVSKIQYHSPLLHLCRMQLVASSDEEPSSNLWEELIQKNYSISTAWSLVKTCVRSASIGISIGAFFLQFLEWWYDREGGKPSFSPLPVPPPPAQRPTFLNSQICPICQKLRKNATALACSGFVFCYPCIFQFVQKNKSCPVTGYPAALQHLVRVYHMDQ